MLGLILRQLLQHKLVFFLFFGVWTTSAYYLITNGDQIFARLHHFLTSQSFSKRQNYHKAYQYILSAELRLKKNNIHLKIIEKSCKNIPIFYKGNIKEFAPHWLAKIEHWQVAPKNQFEQEMAQKDKVNDFPEYWKEKHSFVLESLSDVINAMQFAYEIPLGIVSEKKGLLLVPDVFERYARALCRPQMAMLAWGEYVTFQETRAAKKIQSNDIEKILAELSDNALYIKALLNYIGNTSLKTQNQFVSFCSRKNNHLACIAPKESIITYQKLITIEKSGKTYRRYHINLARSYIIAGNRNPRHKKKYQAKALTQLQLATRFYKGETEARLGRATIFLQQKKYKRALKELRYLKILSLKSQSIMKDFHHLSRRALIGVGRLKDADCFATTKFLPKSKYCQSIKL